MARDHDTSTSDPAPAHSASPDTGDSVRELWRAHRRWVAAILLAHKPREADLEDLLQEVAMRLVRYGDQVEQADSPKAWLRTVAVNVARTHGRKQKVRRRVWARQAPEPETVADPGEDPLMHRADIEEGARALELARTLPEQYREPLILRAVRGMSYRQIADVMGVPVTTVETRIVRARRMLRELMESRQGAAEVV